MKISSSMNKGLESKYASTKTKIKKTKDFNDFLDMSRRGHREQYLSKMLKEINEAGNKVKDTQSSVDVGIYKKCVAEFLNFVLSHSYSIKHVHGRQGLLSVVEIINKELDELIHIVLASQEKNMAIAAQVDRITGLLLDLCT